LKERIRMIKILARLGAVFKPWRSYTDDPFLMLIGTVLSQNTSDRNSRPAFQRLTAKYKSPGQLAKADVRDIQKLIKQAGLYRTKSRRIKQLANLVLERYHGDLRQVLQMSLEDSRQELLSLPGVGYKTADVVLEFAGKRDVVPIDTHIFRVSKRLGFAQPNDDYEEVRLRLEELIPSGRRGLVHMLLIQHGRRYCRAISPLCSECPINDLCPIGILRAKLALL
jgi:endonuclease-3